MLYSENEETKKPTLWYQQHTRQTLLEMFTIVAHGLLLSYTFLITDYINCEFRKMDPSGLAEISFSTVRGCLIILVSVKSSNKFKKYRL